MSTPFHDIAPGPVYWVTGLAGAGKTTLARRLFTALRERGQPAVLLDGDTLREVYGDSPGHHLEGRRVTAWRHAHMCHMLSSQGLPVVIATISMFREIQRWNRANMPGYREIYLDVPLPVLTQRDQKGLYSGALAGRVQNVLGVDLTPEPPEAPDVRLLNDGSLTVDGLLQRALEALGLAP